MLKKKSIIYMKLKLNWTLGIFICFVQQPKYAVRSQCCFRMLRTPGRTPPVALTGLGSSVPRELTSSLGGGPAL